jgi:hypothetical protein
MVVKCNSKTHLQSKFLGFFEPFRLRLTSKFINSANIISIPAFTDTNEPEGRPDEAVLNNVPLKKSPKIPLNFLF